MKAQVSIEFLVITAGLLAIYSLVLPALTSSFQNTTLDFNGNIAKSIVNQIAWKTREVNLLEEESVLYMNFNSPVEFSLAFNNGEISSSFNYSTDANGVADGTLVISKGLNAVKFTKIQEGVQVSSK